MTETLRTVPVLPDSDLASALATATETAQSFIADTGTARYRVSAQRADAPGAVQVARTVAGIEGAAGAWAHHDADALKASIRARRRGGSQPSRRW